MNIFEQNIDTEFHFMVDIETLAITSNAAITEIGAVQVLPGNGNNGFRIDCIDDLNGEWNQQTLDWRKENNLPWYGVGSTQAVNCLEALMEFFDWIVKQANGRTPILWCKGTDFDAVIITNAARRYNLASLIPWKYNNVRDVRTLLQFFPEFKVPKELVKHNGLDDAIMQKEYLLKIANAIGGQRG